MAMGWLEGELKRLGEYELAEDIALKRKQFERRGHGKDISLPITNVVSESASSSPNQSAYESRFGKSDLLRSDATRNLLLAVESYGIAANRGLINLGSLMVCLYSDEKVSKILTDLGAEKESVVPALEEWMGEGTVSGYLNGKPAVALAPWTQEAIEQGARIATRTGRSSVEPIDILQGVLANREWEGAPILDRFGITLESVEAAIRNQ